MHKYEKISYKQIKMIDIILIPLYNQNESKGDETKQTFLTAIVECTQYNSQVLHLFLFVL